MESGLIPTRPVAGSLLSGILSDTLALRSSTLTHQDRKAVSFLAPLAGEDPAVLGTALLELGMDLTGSGLDVILARDTKLFELSGKHVTISQVTIPSFAWNRERDREIRAGITGMMATSGSDIMLVLFTSVFDNWSDLYGEGDPGLIRSLFWESIPARSFSSRW